MSNYINRRQIGTIYGPPQPRPTMYGPPPQKKFSYRFVSLIICAILCSVIAWLFKDCSGYNQPTMYGPSPVDTTQTISPVNNE